MSNSKDKQKKTILQQKNRIANLNAIIERYNYCNEVSESVKIQMLESQIDSYEKRLHNQVFKAQSWKKRALRAEAKLKQK